MVSVNSAYIEDLYFSYLRDASSVDAEWREYFAANAASLAAEYGANGYGAVSVPEQAKPSVVAEAPKVVPPPVPAAPAPAVEPAKPAAQEAAPKAKAEVKNYPPVSLGAQDSAVVISGIAERVVVNMENSLRVPTATSVRTVPVKLLEENRLIINQTLSKRGMRKISFTHVLAWAMVKALQKYPSLNDSFAWVDGKPTRIVRGAVNIGLAVDSTRKDGSRGLVVPSIKDAAKLSFAGFLEAYDGLIAKARDNKLTIDDLTGVTVSLTNPGMIGTIASIPRLMEGQGLIIAAGSINYPVEFAAVNPEILSTMALSKVVTLTSTYDHRIIQGAESGEFLQYMEALLLGDHKFYDSIFASLRIPFEPVRWSKDNALNPFGAVNEHESIEKEGKVVQLINAYRVRGHLYANVNPLGYAAYYYPELDLSHYGFTVWDLERQFDTGGLGGVNRASLRDIITSLRETYCDTVGIEFMHIQAPEKKLWVRSQVEKTKFKNSYTTEEKVDIFRRLVKAETFESFLHTKFLGHKRFSLEGGEALIPMLSRLVRLAARRDVEDIVFGMAHRGRLNVLVNILGKAPEKVFAEFKGQIDPSSFHGSGDVKYHLGAEGFYRDPDTDKQLRMTLAANPSHLETVDPVVEGMARAIHDIKGGTSFDKVFPVLIHGDAAFAGQGVVAETLNMANLKSYGVGGTIHIVINNQIGFTTSPDEARSTTYATDIAKMLQVPVLHVNGHDPEAVCSAVEFAFEYRSVFHEDVIIDLICYRKYGHNEGDEPSYTQPLMYKKIRSFSPPSTYYADDLRRQKVFGPDQAAAIQAEVKAALQEAFDNNADRKIPEVRVQPVDTIFTPLHTAVPVDILKEITEKITTVPQGAAFHPKLVELLEKRRQMVFDDKGMDWGMAEALAIGSLLIEGRPVRLTGQDSCRGTFSHRYAALVDQVNEREIVLLNSIRPGNQETFHVYDSSLSEYAVLGFEYGYSVIRPDGLTMWEAQFGDFFNGAQIVIDQYISAGEEKWGQVSNLVMLLPHGFEGQGPEHSSARLERFLQLAAQNNMIVANFATPTNYFHALRRQALSPIKKPLVVMSPKSNLRLQATKVSDLAEGRYQEIIDDVAVKRGDVRRVLLCSGKLYHELVAYRDKIGAGEVAIVRVEQLYPFHADLASSIIHSYEHAKEVVWVQEEPKNQGAWFFVAPRLAELLRVDQSLRYAGRPEAASPATGYMAVHIKEQQALIAAAFGR